MKMMYSQSTGKCKLTPNRYCIQSSHFCRQQHYKRTDIIEKDKEAKSNSDEIDELPVCLKIDFLCLTLDPALIRCI